MKDGKLHGPARLVNEKHENPTIREGQWSNGETDGFMRTIHNDGVYFYAFNKNGKPHGPNIVYNIDGSLYASGYNENGKRTRDLDGEGRK